MREITPSAPLAHGMRPEAAKRRVEAFRKRFGDAHLYLAYHAAFPLALTPDLLYRLRTNFQRDIHSKNLNIPWIAVADLLLSSLCSEIGYELYEMNVAVRAELLGQLKVHPDFGPLRISDLSNFLLKYVQQQLESHDHDIRDFAQAQYWTALAAIDPEEAAQSIALTLSRLDPRDRTEFARLGSLIETFTEPSVELTELLAYTRGMELYARGDYESAKVELSKVARSGWSPQIMGVDLPIPEQLRKKTEKELKQRPTLRRNFYISYHDANRTWAEWLAWQLEEVGYSVMLQAWNFQPDAGFTGEIDAITQMSERLVIVLSPDYLRAFSTMPQWIIAFAEDPRSRDERHTLIAVQVCECISELKEMLGPIAYTDLVGLDESEALETFLADIRRLPELLPVPLSGEGVRHTMTKQPSFPGVLSSELNRKETPNELSVIDWGVIIENAAVERFVGRERELQIFHKHLKRTPPRYLIFYITGQGGVGKSTLLSRYRGIAKDLSFLLADSNEQQQGVPAVLGRFAQQLAEQGLALKSFNERYKVYRQKMHEVEIDPEAPRGLAAILGRAAVSVTFTSSNFIPGLSKGLELVSREEIETQASEWATYLTKKLTNRDEIALVSEPTPILTSLFFEDLNEIAKKQHVLLCFENFEATRRELQDWLLHIREYKPSLNIRIAIAGRDQPGASWDSLRSVMMIIPLDVFTVQEAEVFLDTYKIVDARQRAEILEISERLPLLMSWLVVSEGQETDSSVVPSQIIERFLRWVVEPTWRQLALLAAIPRTFNLDILKLLVAHYNQTIDVQAAFDWLVEMPFVRQIANGWQYHGIVRHMMLRYQRQRSPQVYRQMHKVLADFYNVRRNKLGIAYDEQWADELWCEDTLAYAYHFLITDPIKHWGEVLSLFVVAIRKNWSFAIKLIELLSLENTSEELSRQQMEIVSLLHQQLQAVEDGNLADGFAMFNMLCDITDLSPQAKGYALAYRGECYDLKGEWKEALSDFKEALRYIPGDALVIARRGEFYYHMGRYQDALTNFDRAIALDEKEAEAYARRGETYRLMERYEEALADFDRAIALDESFTFAFTQRGKTYRLMERYQEALADFDHAIGLDPNDVGALIERGETYCQMLHYEEAVADFDQAVALDEKYYWAIASRGQTYQLMGRYSEALVDFNRAIELNDKWAWVFAQRGETYRLMGRYQEALADYSRAIELDGKYFWALASRGETYSQMEHYQDALMDFDLAIALEDKQAWLFDERGETYRQMEHYQEALADFDRAIELDPTIAGVYVHRGNAYRSLAEYGRAIEDYDRAIELDSEDSWAYVQRGNVYRLLAEYEQAIADYNRAIELDPSYDGAYFYRGLMYLLLKDSKHAQTDFLQASKLDPRDTNAAWMAEWAIMCRERPGIEIVQRLEEIAGIDPQHYVAHVCLGVALGLRGKLKEGLAELERAISQEPEEWDPYFWKGVLCAYYYRGRSEAVTEAIEKALKVDLPPILLTPLYWLEKDVPNFFEEYAAPLLARYGI